MENDLTVIAIFTSISVILLQQFGCSVRSLFIFIVVAMCLYFCYDFFSDMWEKKPTLAWKGSCAKKIHYGDNFIYHLDISLHNNNNSIKQLYNERDLTDFMQQISFLIDTKCNFNTESNHVQNFVS